MFGKLFNKAKSKVKTFQSKDLAEAAVAAGVLVMYADGDASDNEVDTLLTVLEASPALSEFRAEIPAIFEGYCKLMESSPRLGKRDLMKEIKECACDPEEAETVLIVALDVGDADGNDPKEEKVLQDIATALKLKLSDYA